MKTKAKLSLLFLVFGLSIFFVRRLGGGVKVATTGIAAGVRLREGERQRKGENERRRVSRLRV